MCVDPDASEKVVEPAVTRWDRDHWSLKPLVPPNLPDQTPSSAWNRNPIDAFILQGMAQDEVVPLGPAYREQLLRRLKFDLVGLPPTPEERRRFSRDFRPDAYSRLVDSLLASPGFGEHWAQYWLDLARYAETDGFEHDKVRPEAWRYRDWVIGALNRDVPFDQFVRFQIVGESAEHSENHVATMFCMAGPDMPDINEQDLRRHDKLNEITSTVGSALLAMQMHCAQCHDHKYDPISQADFYRLRAVFESAVPLMKRDVPVLQLTRVKVPQPRLYFRGELNRPGPHVRPGFPRVATAVGKPFLCNSNHPRGEFCDWLTSESNPLTARVIANRVWQHHFGRSLTENPSDFGVIAEGPSHPQLLDWLATELIRHDWNLKWLHRTIVLSSTYRQAGSASEPFSNYSGFPRRRLQGEVIRDAMLLSAGQLDRTVGGPSVMPRLPPELISTLLKGQWKASSREQDNARRSIYTFARRNLRFPIFDVFDRPDAGTSCAMRTQTTTPTQSLQMLNSPFTVECAQKLATRLLAEVSGNGSIPTDEAQTEIELIERLFIRLLARQPTREETHWLQQIFGQCATRSEALMVASVSLMNTNEFLYID